MNYRHFKIAVRYWSASRMASILVTTATLLLTAGTAWYAALTARQNDRARFENAVQHTEDAIQERVNVHLALLRGATALFSTYGQVSREQFQQYVARMNLQQNYPGLAGVAYAERVDRDQLAASLARLRQLHGPSFDIHPAGERPVYFPVTYVEPATSTNLPAIGWDLSAEPVRHRAMAYARDIGKAAASTRLLLMQAGDAVERSGFVMYVPIFAGENVSRDLWQRRADLRGYICGAFRSQDLFAHVFPRETNPPLHFDVYAGVLVRDQNLLFSSRAAPAAEPLLTRTDRLYIPGLTWTIVFSSTPAFDAASTSHWPYWIAVIGIIISGILFAAMEALAKAQRRAARNLVIANSELERKVHERTARLAETVADLEHFSYSITHDMRAPLRAMRSYALLLTDEPQSIAPAARDEYLRRIAAASHRMDQLICDALNYAKAAKDQLDLHPTQPDVILRDLIETYPAFQPPMARIDLDGHFPPVLANEAGLIQCFSNILNNAVKFVPRGTTPHVRVWAETDGNRVRLNFRDNGIGIPADQHERIFGMFQQLHPSSEYEGTGIGLALVKKVTSKMRARVGVDSTPGQGSTFWLAFLPASFPNPSLKT